MFSRAVLQAAWRRALFAAYTVAAVGLACRLSMVVLALTGLPQPWRPACPAPPPPPPQQPPPPPAAEEPAAHFLVVLVASAPSAEGRRRALRDTWLGGCARGDLEGTSCYFVVGTAALGEWAARQLAVERDVHRDMLLLPDLVDSPANATLKMLQAFAWADREAVAQYVMKCDDDAFVRLTPILNELREGDTAPSAASIYWGFFSGNTPVEVVGKWWEGAWVLCDFYLPYAHGGGYVLGARLLRFIARSHQELQLYQRDDVSVGAWLAPLRGVRRVHDPRFDTEAESRGCHNSYLVTRGLGADDMAAMWERLRWGSDKPCPGGEEARLRLSYLYDWDAPPSRCCRRHDPSVP